MRFLNLTIANDIPDSKTVWHFTERIKDLALAKNLFDLFGKELDKLGFIVNQGKIVAASFVKVPGQRNGREKNQQIKEGKGDELWNNKPAKKAQKDVDAKSKLIDIYVITDASVHNSQTIDDLLNQKDILENHQLIDKVHEKGYKNKLLAEEQKANNTEKSRIRARVEHVFGFMENSMKPMYYRKVGIKRAEIVIELNEFNL
jgi:IS5 family transposase